MIYISVLVSDTKSLVSCVGVYNKRFQMSYLQKKYDN